MNRQVQCFTDKDTGECLDIVDAGARELIAEIKETIKNLSGVEGSFATDEDIAELNAKLEQLGITHKNDVDEIVAAVNSYVPPIEFAENERQKSKNLYSGVDVVATTFQRVILSKPLLAGTYTISADVTSADTDNSVCLINFNNELDSQFLSLHATRTSKYVGTFTLQEDCYFIYFYASSNYASSENDSFSFTNIQIEKGSVATEYQDYNGGLVHQKELDEAINNIDIPEVDLTSIEERLAALEGAGSGGLQSITFSTYSECKTWLDSNFDKVVMVSETCATSPLVSVPRVIYTIADGSITAATSTKNFYFQSNGIVYHYYPYSKGGSYFFSHSCLQDSTGTNGYTISLKFQSSSLVKVYKVNPYFTATEITAYNLVNLDVSAISSFTFYYI